MSLSGFGDLSHRMDRLAREMGGQAQAARLKQVGIDSKGDITKAVKATIGDESLSGWRRGKPFSMAGSFQVVSDHELVLSPLKRGPMRVLEQGRHLGQSNAMQGPGISKDGTTSRTKSGGLRKVRTSKAKRWNGYTQPKHTWTHATETMTREMPKRYEHELAADMAIHSRSLTHG